MPKGDDSNAQGKEARLTMEFIKLRTRTLWIGAVPFLLGIALFFAAACGVELPSFGLPWSATLTLPGALAGWGLVYMYVAYRCPRCGASIVGSGVFKGAAFDLSAQKCPECALPLRSPAG
jgi:hypothetical protein